MTPYMNKLFLPVFLTAALYHFGINTALHAGENDVIITEIMYNPSGFNAGGEFVEIYNRGSTDVDVSNWQLIDSAQVMFTLPAGTTLAAGRYLIFYDDNTAPDFYGLDMNFSHGPYTGGLDGGGERVQLKDAGGTVINEVTYDDDWPWPTDPDGNGPSLELLDPWLDNNEGTSWGVGQPYSPGAVNTPALSGGGDVVITEIMYGPRKLRYLETLNPFWVPPNPDDPYQYWDEGDDPDGEYIELFNRTAKTIDLTGWQLLDEEGCLYEFVGEILDANSYLVVCSDSAAIANRYGITNTTGNFTTAGDRLSNGGERLTLINDFGVVVDTVRYRDAPPWPIAPDQLGVSMECLDPFADNADPANWRSWPLAGSPPMPTHQWQYLEVTGIFHETGTNELCFYIDGSGEWLVDQIVMTLYGGGTNIVSNGSFDPNDSSWLKTGNHSSTYHITEDFHDGTGCERIIATAAGDSTTNRLYQLLSGLQDGQEYTISCWVKYLSGHQTLTFRMAGESFQTTYIGAGHWNSSMTTSESTAIFDGILHTALSTVNGSGLMNGTTHSIDHLDAWHTTYNPSHTPRMAPSGTICPEWVAYDFGQSFPIDRMWVWNMNQWNHSSAGLSDVTIDYSTDGITWNTLGNFLWPRSAPAIGMESANYTGFAGPDFGGISARYIVIAARENYGSTYFGLSEVRFDLVPGPMVTIVAAETGFYNGIPPNPSVGDEVFLNRGTAGTPNERTSNGIPPFVNVDTLKHSPKRPTSSDPVIISVTVTSQENITRVILDYQVFVPPYQIAAQTQAIEIFDNGLNGDEIGGDGTYSTTIGALSSQSLVRYRLTAADSSDRTWTWPDEYEPNPNRAYFVYDDGDVVTNLPIYFLIAPQSSLDTLAANVWSHEYQPCTLVADGIVYDNTGVHYRGQGGRESQPKKGWKITFNKTEYLNDLSSVDLVPHEPTQQKAISDLFWSIGQGNLATEIVRYHINGSLYGVCMAQEPPGASSLRRRGLDGKGETYKANAIDWPYNTHEVESALDYYDPAVYPGVYPKLYEKKSDPLGSYQSLIDLTYIIAKTPENEIYNAMLDTVNFDEWLYKWAVNICGANFDIMGSNYSIVKPAEPDLKWQWISHDFTEFFGSTTLNPYGYYNKWQERLFVNPQMENRFLVILDDLLRNYNIVENMCTRLDREYEKAAADLQEEVALQGWYWLVLDYSGKEARKAAFTARCDWLLNSWLPSKTFTRLPNAHPMITVNPIQVGNSIRINWAYTDAENDASTVDLFWTDMKWSYLQPIPNAKNLPAEQGYFLWSQNLPEDFMSREIYIHAVIGDGNSYLVGRYTCMNPIYIPENCQDIWSHGSGLAADLDQNCHVNLKDFALFADAWLVDNFSITLVPENAPKRVLLPTISNPANDNWKGGQSFDDSSWNDYTFVPGKSGGVGYETTSGYDDFISYNVGNANGNETRYIRIHFHVNSEDLTQLTDMTLRVRYDDAFVAYVNGVEVARSEYAPDSLGWNSGATDFFGDLPGMPFVDFDISAYISTLQLGDNVLAIHALNCLTTSSDFLVSTELIGGTTNPLSADFDENMSVNLNDLLWFASQWLSCNDPSDNNCSGS